MYLSSHCSAIIITILTGLKSNDQLHYCFIQIQTLPAKLSISLIRKFYSYIVVNKLWLALEWYNIIPMLWLALNGAHYG